FQGLSVLIDSQAPELHSPQSHIQHKRSQKRVRAAALFLEGHEQPAYPLTLPFQYLKKQGSKWDGLLKQIRKLRHLDIDSFELLFLMILLLELYVFAYNQVAVVHRRLIRLQFPLSK